MNISRKEYSQESYMEKIVLGTRVKDIQQVLGELIRLASDSTHFLYDRLDLERIGVWGWSIGGAAAGNICTIDDRFKAGVNLDGWDWMNLQDTSKYLADFMYLQSDREEIGAKELLIAGMRRNSFEERELQQKKYEKHLFANSHSDVYNLKIIGSMHSNFRDHGFLSLGQLGSGDAEKITELTNQYLRAFFDLYLKGKAIRLFDSEFGGDEWVTFRRNQKTKGLIKN